MATEGKIPVTVLTGFLGSGKTTLLNRILTEQHGQRIAVIENEFGEIGIDQALVINADEEIFEMNNGCICCTVRGDLIRILNNLKKRRGRFDRVLVETTGMADPGPVAQTFFVDEEVRELFFLDGIVTLVDAKHAGLHLDDSDECAQQIAFADVIVLNKTDLVSRDEAERVEARVRSMNAAARVLRASMAKVELRDVLDVGGFDLGRALAQKPRFLEPEYPFEWAGAYDLDEGVYTLALADGPDAAMSAALAPALAGDDGFKAGAEAIFRLFSSPSPLAGPLVPGAGCALLDLSAPGEKRFEVRIPARGRHVLYTQHLPSEFALELRDARGRVVAPVASREFAAAHTHDDTVGSVGIHLEGAIDGDRLDAWLSALLRDKGADIFRMKGILNIAGSDRRFVFQGVHMLFDGREERPWGDQPRSSDLVFIGRNLDRASLSESFARCLA